MGTQLVNGRLEQCWGLAKDRPGQEAETAAQETQCYVKSINFYIVILLFGFGIRESYSKLGKNPVVFFNYINLYKQTLTCTMVLTCIRE